MKLYLLRHAEATYDAPSDEARPLTVKGEKSITALGNQLKAKEFSGLKEIWHSGLVRAEQTAEQFNDMLELDLPLRQRDHLRPEDSPLPLIAAYMDSARDIMVVGHNPHLTYLATLLLTGDVRVPVIEFKKSGLLCLERAAPADDKRPYGHWVLRWFLVPKVVG